MNKELKVFKYRSMNDANAYLLINKDTNKAILIDGGYQEKVILDFIETNKLQLTDIFITHFHHDHIVSVDQIALKTSAKIHIHQAELESLFNEQINGSQYGFLVDFQNKNIQFDIFNKEEVLEINDYKIQIFPKGGHTKGTSFYLIDNDKLFIGDTLFINGIGYHKKMFENIKHPLKLMFDLTCDDSLFFESILSIKENYSNCLLYPGHWEEGFKIDDVLNNSSHPYHSIKK
ncbi:MBL fold metallo-hydrolase [Spiroplasma diminutum]|uniref:Metallo-beta-lactamase domain-containing protein n=1 Tax=Spiroplasma diminutum CUAS-1 TaxID=1276221 RepID=S5MJ03_9MOLU|nr:MBL fold metallo-hydrolase [Spiroplasma diminutum]AGR41925.1 hypothetical protein SDIMI_v3c02210 [Spiroplasma diminutum CUAS-1]